MILRVLAAASLMVLAVPVPVTAAPGEATDSAVTVTGRKGRFDDFTKLKVTVSQTRNLTSQAVTVTWTGGDPTPRNRLGANFLQFMQCWGPDPDAPDFRETCQFGAGLGSPAWGDAGASGNLNNRTPSTVDKAEELPADAQMVPFRAATGEKTPHGGAASPFPVDPTVPQQPGQPPKRMNDLQVLAQFFGVYTTNEVPVAITTADGTGRAVFEVQTAVQAPHLGCGANGRKCWLVVVPRGHHDPYDGTDLGDAGGPVFGSPLSPALWENRMVVPLDFEPIGAFCPIGKKERQTVGSELVAEALTSWQPALCAGNGPVFGYAQTGDLDAARQVLSPAPGAPGMAFTSDPVVPGPGEPAVVHAPLALSAAVIAFTIDVKVDAGVPADVERLRATMVRELKLTPRLVAKLLTYSYQRDVPGGQQGKVEYLKNNPRSIRFDPEFLDLNPLFKNYASSGRSLDGLIVSIGDYAAAREVWRWILADPDAKRWLNGESDANKMVVNRHYADMHLPDNAALLNFPKADPSCFRPAEAGADYCQLDLRPYMNTMREAGYQTLRADAKSKIEWDALRLPPAFKASAPQVIGERWTMSITDAASSARFGLRNAALRNRAGQFVVPSDQTLKIAVDAMVPSGVGGVLKIDPNKVVPTAYPLAMLTYAAADVTEPLDARRDYAKLLRHAAGAGQTPGPRRGELPAGYVPLPDPLRAQLRTAATLLERPAPPLSPAPDGPPGPPPGPDTPDNPTPTTTTPVPPPSNPPAPGNPPTTGTPSPQPPSRSVAQSTPGQRIGLVRYALIAALAAGLAGAVAGPILLKLSKRGARRRVDGA